jgi:hypothetical protein
MKVKASVATLGLIVFLPASAETVSPVTFNKDVLPILQANCQGCHRPGQMAPMSFLTYNETRPWAKAIKEAVMVRKMPPWFADPNHGNFTNDSSLKKTDIDTLTRWVDSGAREGDPQDAPQPVKWPDGWVIQPDIVVKGSVTDVPASTRNNVFEWLNIIVPTGFQTDTWVTSVQIKPKYPQVTHHICIVGYLPHTPDIQYYVPDWKDKERDEDGSAIPSKGPTFGGQKERSVQGGGDCYVPGNPAGDYRSFDAAKLVPAGSDMLLSLHYTPNGSAVRDEVLIGFTVMNSPPKRRYVTFFPSAPVDPKLFAIPPRDPNWQSPPVDVTFNADAELVYMMPHMHSRGKDMTYTLEYPDGRKEIVLHVPRFDFNWQLGYHTSVKVPKGSKLHVDAHFDNSSNNKGNPNPDKTVYYGEMTWEEMMMPFFGVVVDVSVQPDEILTKPRAPAGA